MRRIVMFIFGMLYFKTAFSQNIFTFAGTGAVSYSGDGGPATNAGIGYPGTIAFDKAGNCYFSELNNTIRKVSTSGVISTVAGNAT